MLPALGKPMVVRVMERFYRAGIRRYLIVLGVQEGGVAAYLRQWMAEKHIEFFLKSNETLLQVLMEIAQQHKQPFVIATYNSFTYERFVESLLNQHIDYADALLLTGAHLSLSASPDQHYAHLQPDDPLRITTDAPTERSSGFVLAEHMIFGQHVVEYLNSLDSQHASTHGHSLYDIARLYAASPGAEVRIAETSWVLDVKRDADLLTLNKRLLEDSNDAHILSELPQSVKVNPPVRIDPQVSVGQDVVIGPNVYIERGSSIGSGSRLQNALVLEKSTVRPHSTVDGQIVTSRGVVDV